jgi:hypothetical protein
MLYMISAWKSDKEIKDNIKVEITEKCFEKDG